MLYEYKCPECGAHELIEKPMSMVSKKEYCSNCDVQLTRVYECNLSGTKDGFWRDFKKPFFHKDKNGQIRRIESHKEWERAGYTDPLNDTSMPSDVKQEMKRKVEKIKKYDNKKRFSVKMS